MVDTLFHASNRNGFVRERLLVFGVIVRGEHGAQPRVRFHFVVRVEGAAKKREAWSHGAL